MISKKNIILFHYLFLIYILIDQLTLSTKLNILSLIMCLFLFITTNLKFFFIGNKTKILSLLNLIDIILYLCIFQISGSISFLFFMLPVIDSFYFSEKKYRSILIALNFITYIHVVNNNTISITLSYLILFVIFTKLIYIFNNLVKSKNNIENELEQLQEKNDELESNQENLELYNDSIEDLIALKERNRISREIHDSVGHGLSTIIIQLNALSEIAKRKPEVLPEQINNLNEFAKKNLQEVRFALRELKPKNYNRYESIILIHSLIREFKNLTGIFVQLSFSENIAALSDEQNHTLYKAVQEFLSNSAKYAKASKIKIHFSYTEHSLIVTLQDNGIGCTEIKKGIGLTAIEERMKEGGDAVYYESLPKIKGFFMKLVFLLKNNYDTEQS